MTSVEEKTISQLSSRLDGRLSLPGSAAYVAAMDIWAKRVGAMPRAVAHCGTAGDVQRAIRAARDAGLPLSIRSGGHDWAGRALCEGLVIDLSRMNGVHIDAESGTARIASGARASDVLSATDPIGLAAVTGSTGVVGMAGLTLGGGYGPLIGRFGLALDNLIAAEVVLADGRIISAGPEQEEELFWALRGGGGNFGVVTQMQHRLHHLPTVRSGVLLFPFAEARAVLSGTAGIAASAPDALTVQIGLAAGPDGAPAVLIIPTWCGAEPDGETQLAPFLRLGTLLMNAVAVTPYGASLTAFDAHIVNGQRVLMDTCWLPALDDRSIGAFVEAMAGSVSPGCVIVTHEFKGAAVRVPAEVTAFGFRREHVLVEIIASFSDEDGFSNAESQHRAWVQVTLDALKTSSFPGGYPNLLAPRNFDRAAQSYGPNAGRLSKAKQRYDPDNVFNSVIPLPVGA